MFRRNLKVNYSFSLEKKFPQTFYQNAVFSLTKFKYNSTQGRNVTTEIHILQKSLFFSKNILQFKTKTKKSGETSFF